MKTLLTISILILVTGCSQIGSYLGITYIRGTVLSSKLSSSEPIDKSFFIYTENATNLTDQLMLSAISKHLITHGYRQVDAIENASILVRFYYRVSAGKQHISGGGSYAGNTGSSYVDTYTLYQRYFKIVLIDRIHTTDEMSPQILWQGEVFSEGSSSNIGTVGQYFVAALFDQFGKGPSSTTFSKMMK